MIITITGIIATMVSVGKAVDSTVGAFGKFKDFLGGVDTKTLKTTAIVFGIVAALIALAAIIAVLSGQGDNLSRTMDSVGDSVGKINRNIQKQQAPTQYYADGTDYAPGGWSWTGEHGPELKYLPTGSKVIDAENSKKIAGGDTYNVNLTLDAKNARDFTDALDFMQRMKPAIRAGRSRI